MRILPVMDRSVLQAWQAEECAGAVTVRTPAWVPTPLQSSTTLWGARGESGQAVAAAVVWCADKGLSRRGADQQSSQRLLVQGTVHCVVVGRKSLTLRVCCIASTRSADSPLVGRFLVPLSPSLHSRPDIHLAPSDRLAIALSAAVVVSLFGILLVFVYFHLRLRANISLCVRVALLSLTFCSCSLSPFLVLCQSFDELSRARFAT